MSTSEVPGPPTQRFLATDTGRHLFAPLFLNACDPGPTDELLQTATRAPLVDPGLLPGETERVMPVFQRVSNTSSNDNANDLAHPGGPVEATTSVARAPRSRELFEGYDLNLGMVALPHIRHTFQRSQSPSASAHDWVPDSRYRAARVDRRA